MANELTHGSVGTELTQAEWEAVGAHVFNSQAAGDILYASTTAQLTRLAKGADNTVLHLASGIPAWSATLAGLTLTTPTISSTGFANATHAHAASNSGGTISAGALSGTTLASSVVTTSATTVGALASGTIASGFGTINNGSSTITTTGAITGGSLVADATTINSNTISVSSANLTLDPDNDIIFSPSGISQNYGMSDRGHGLTLQSLTSGSDFRWEMFTADGDNDGIFLYLYAKGTPAAVTNIERGVWYYDTGNTRFHFGTDASGSGTARDLRIGVPAGQDIILGDDAAVLTVKGNSTTSHGSASGTGGVVNLGGVYKTGLSDNAVTPMFTITSTNESGDADMGAYTCVVTGIAGHRINTDTGAHAAKFFRYVFGRTIRGDGTGLNTAVTEIYESAVAASASGTRSIGTVTMTVTETSEYVMTVNVQVDLSGSSISTAELMVSVELTWAQFTTEPVLAAA